MAELSAIVDYLNELLLPHNFADYCPNGLQVEGKLQVKKIISGVTASQALLDAAIAEKGDLILVHHGYFWKGEAESIVGIKRDRIKKLLVNDISLLAYHLPLDAHEEFGNNVQLAHVLKIEKHAVLQQRNDISLVCVGELEHELTGDAFAIQIEQALQRAPLHIPGKAKMIKNVAWCTGGAQGYIEQAIAAGVDAYITGEVSEKTVHLARESGIHFFSAGHHATERYGAKALGAHLAEQFELEHQFIDIDNPA